MCANFRTTADKLESIADRIPDNFSMGHVRSWLRFWELVLRYDRPGWQSDNTVVLETAAFRLRRFGQAREGTPILVIGPQAGHHTCIVDYAIPGQSLVQLCAEQTAQPVYAIEWKSANPARMRETVDDLVKQTDRCVDFMGGKAHILGLCQGGWQSSIYAALFPHKTASIVIGGAPIDFTAGGGKIQEIVQSLPISYYAGLVMSGFGLMTGRYIVTGFKNMNPYDRYIDDYSKLFLGINNPKVVDRFRTFRRWYEFTQSLPGGWYLQVVHDLFKRNLLVRGKLTVLGRKVNLADITCPTVLIAGENDDITLEPQVHNMADYVSGETKKMTIPNCGHIGIFVKREALSDFWKPALDFVLARENARE
jgi:poly(3-hydroxyalkanoate) synthetase